MRARAEFRNWTPEGWHDAIDLSGNLEGDVAEGVRFARRAIERGKKDPDALRMGGWTILTMGDDRATGLSAIEHALRLNPNSASPGVSSDGRKAFITDWLRP
jgi:hypothetical protein